MLTMENIMVVTGLERVFEPEYIKILAGKKVGLIVNQASIDSKINHAADLFRARKDFSLTALFGPQHGIRGETQDNMIEWKGFRDPDTGVPVYSLYSETREPTSEMLAGLDVLVFDVQDVGTRIYTFIWTMTLAMKACARNGITFVVLDRPNPVGGYAIEGNVLDPDFASFVGLYPIPMRHGMTVAEIALYMNAEHGIGCELEIVPMHGWSRDMHFPATGMPWVMPSPNMPTPDTAVVYPGTVLFEGTNISEGRGTTRPFEIIGAPWIDPRKLTDRMNALRIPGLTCRLAQFQPTFQKWQGRVCGGVQLHVTDPAAYKPYIAALHLITEIRRLDRLQFEWKRPPYEYEYNKLPIDIMCGSDTIRLAIEDDVPVTEIAASWQPALDAFAKRRARHLLY